MLSTSRSMIFSLSFGLSKNEYLSSLSHTYHTYYATHLTYLRENNFKKTSDNGSVEGNDNGNGWNGMRNMQVFVIWCRWKFIERKII
jgi:hypothetical protein